MSNDSEPAANRHKASIADDLVCPITLELPWDPVTAEDGRVYERSAILKHFEANPGSQVKSPMLNTMIGKRLLPATQHKNIIETATGKGLISGDLANKWKAKKEQQLKVEKLIKEAKAGDLKAMEEVGKIFFHGVESFDKNYEEAFKWYEKAHLAGSLKGAERLGWMLIEGEGVEKDEARGVVFLVLAAERASGFGAYKLGKCYGRGECGISFNRGEAIHWLQKALASNDSTLNESNAGRAKALLDELMDES